MDRRVRFGAIVLALALALVACGLPTTAVSPLITPPAPPTQSLAPTATIPVATSIPSEGIRPIVTLRGDIFAVDQTTGAMEQITNRGDCHSPAWSPSGKVLAMVCGQGIKSDIYLWERGKGLSPLTRDDMADETPRWSPDGRLVAYVKATDSNGDGRITIADERHIWLMDGQGIGQAKIVAGYDPAWSPDGRHLVYATNGQLSAGEPFRRDNAIALVGVDGRGAREVIGVGALPKEVNLGGSIFGTSLLAVRYPAWSPDGNTIAFSAQGHTGLMGSIPVGGGKATIYGESYEGGFGQVSFSPDGKYLAYQEYPPIGLGQVWMLDLATGQKASLGARQEGISAGPFAWSPDGKVLAYLAEASSGEVSLMLVGPAETTPKELVKFGRAEGLREVAWRP